jgi:hypothetical protein
MSRLIRENRIAILDGKTCAACGVDGLLLNHHIAHAHKGCIEICILVCPACHRKIHIAMHDNPVIEYEERERNEGLEAIMERYYSKKISWKICQKHLTEAYNV